MRPLFLLQVLTSLCYPQSPWCMVPPPTSIQLFLPPWLPANSTRRTQFRQMQDNILAEGDKQRFFSFKNNSLLCKLLCWAESCWGRVQVHRAPARRALTEGWQYFTAPRKSASRFFQSCLMTVSETWQQHWADTTIRNYCPRPLPTPAFATADSVWIKRLHNMQLTVVSGKGLAR